MRPQDVEISPAALLEAQKACTVRIVDDDDALRDALRFVLETEGWRVADFSDAERFFVEDLPSEPGCAILDIRMHGMSGMEAQSVMAERCIDLPIIFLTGHGDIDMAVAAMQYGAVDFIAKPVDHERLLKAIAYAASLNLSKRSGRAYPGEILEKFALLTDREKEIARLLAQGRINREIAERLGIAQRTVEVHRAAVLKKLGVKKVSELRVFETIA